MGNREITPNWSVTHLEQDCGGGQQEVYMGVHGYRKLLKNKIKKEIIDERTKVKN